MTIEKAVDFFLNKTVNAARGNRHDYFCGMTNNPQRRKGEHGAHALLVEIPCSNKKTAQALMRKLAESGFDVDKDIMSGQDDSVNVYAYKKTNQTIQQLSKTVTIDFQERWYDEDHLDDLPQTNGIYCCYSCDRRLVNNTYQNPKPLYIGLASNGFWNRINNHKSEDHEKWKMHQHMGNDKQLVYAIAEFDSEILQTVEAALIYKNGTPENTEYREGYQGEYHTITVICTGYTGGLKRSVTAVFR